jgi:hypothetical protein
VADVYTFVNALDTALQHPTTGVNAQLQAIDPTQPPIAAFYSTWDAVDTSPETVALWALHVSVEPDIASSLKRDWRHRVLFLYQNQFPDSSDRRQAAARTLTALMRAIDPEVTQIADRISGVINIEVGGASVIWERDADHRDQLILAQIDFITREELQ